jgi:hypothetical protein
VTILNRLLLYAIVALLGLVSLGGIYAAGYIKGAGNERAKCQTAALEDRIAELERDLDAQRVADVYEEFAWEMMRERNEQLEQEKASYDDTVAADPHVVKCTYTPDRIRRLRILRGLKG